MSLYTLRHEQMDPALAAKLFSFVNAYRPHDTPYSWRELREEGLDPLDDESVMDFIEDRYMAELEFGL